jgi:hypothetical protein
MSFTSYHPDELDDLAESKGIDPSQIVGHQPEGLDGEHSFYYQDNTGSGFDEALRHGHNVQIERGVSYAQLKRMPQMNDAKLAQYIQEEDADEQNDRYEDREDYQSNQDLLSEGNDIYKKALADYNKAHDVKKQTIHYSDYP